MRMPPARGDLSAWLAAALRQEPTGLPASLAPPPVSSPGPAWEDEDLQLALWCCYELHYRGFEGVDEGWEGQPAIVGLRGSLEQWWLAALRSAAGEGGRVLAGELPGALTSVIRSASGPDLSGYLAREADRSHPGTQKH